MARHAGTDVSPHHLIAPESRSMEKNVSLQVRSAVCETSEREFTYHCIVCHEGTLPIALTSWTATKWNPLAPPPIGPDEVLTISGKNDSRLFYMIPV